MGALGCSEGPGPSSVVWACKVRDAKDANAKAEMARLNLNRLFIETSRTITGRHCITWILIALPLMQMPCQTAGADRGIKPFVFSSIACAWRRLSEVEDLSRWPRMAKMVVFGQWISAIAHRDRALA
jgi:hypothetical protein